MLNLGEYHTNNNHVNISTELKIVQSKLREYPNNVKLDLAKMTESE